MSKGTEYILQEFERGNIIIPLSASRNYGIVEIAEFIKQPADGMLYDFDLMEEQCDLDTVHGVRKFAIAKTIRALKNEIDRLSHVPEDHLSPSDLERIMEQGLKSRYRGCGELWKE